MEEVTAAVWATEKAAEKALVTATQRARARAEVMALALVKESARWKEQAMVEAREEALEFVRAREWGKVKVVKSENQKEAESEMEREKSFVSC